jgi:hypothetical protein
MPSLSDIDHDLRSPRTRYPSDQHLNNLSASIMLPVSSKG